LRGSRGLGPVAVFAAVASAIAIAVAVAAAVAVAVAGCLRNGALHLLLLLAQLSAAIDGHAPLEGGALH